MADVETKQETEVAEEVVAEETVVETKEEAKPEVKVEDNNKLEVMHRKLKKELDSLKAKYDALVENNKKAENGLEGFKMFAEAQRDSLLETLPEDVVEDIKESIEGLDLLAQIKQVKLAQKLAGINKTEKKIPAVDRSTTKPVTDPQAPKTYAEYASLPMDLRIKYKDLAKNLPD